MRCKAETAERFCHELRRPHADLLRDGVYELRAKAGRVNYRILYFFDGTSAIVLSHGLTKEKAVPAVDVERAVTRKKCYEKDRSRHTAKEDVL